MGADANALHDAVLSFHRDGSFGEDEYAALRRVVADVGRVDASVLDGFIGLFFERHLLDDVRRAELAAMQPDELVRAVRHRFKQVVAGGHDSQQAWHALSAHVRDALQTLTGPGASGFPVSITGNYGFSAIAVEQAVAAAWAERGARPSTNEATRELFERYVAASAPREATSTSSREYPAVLTARLDARRLARGVLEVLKDDEKRLFKAQLDGEPVDEWAQQNGVSRATAYRMLSRIKALCRVEFDARSSRTRLEVLDAIRREL